MPSIEGELRCGSSCLLKPERRREFGILQELTKRRGFGYFDEMGTRSKVGFFRTEDDVRA